MIGRGKAIANRAKTSSINKNTSVDTDHLNNNYEIIKRDSFNNNISVINSFKPVNGSVPNNKFKNIQQFQNKKEEEEEDDCCHICDRLCKQLFCRTCSNVWKVLFNKKNSISISLIEVIIINYKL
jgi:hypothetical protein